MTEFMMDNGAQGGKFRNLLRARDIFLHDGKTLRRIRVSVPLQLSAAAAALSTLCWSVFATAQLATVQPATVTVSNADTAQVQQQVQAMRAEVAAIRQQVQARYQFTAKEVRRLGLDPKRVAYTGKGGPYEAYQPLQAAATPISRLCSPAGRASTSWSRARSPSLR